MSFSADLALAYPQLILGCGALLLLVVGAFAPRATAAVCTAAVAVLLGAAYVAATQPFGRAFAGGLISDAGAAFAQVAIYIASAIAMMRGRFGLNGRSGMRAGSSSRNCSPP